MDASTLPDFERVMDKAHGMLGHNLRYGPVTRKGKIVSEAIEGIARGYAFGEMMDVETGERFVGVKFKLETEAGMRWTGMVPGLMKHERTGVSRDDVRKILQGAQLEDGDE